LKRLALFVVLSLSLASTATAVPLVLDFEDQPDSFAGILFPTAYQDVVWTSWLHYAPYEPNGYDPNGRNAIYAAVDGARFTFSDRVFVGANFSAPYLDTAPYTSQLYFELFQDGALVHTSAQLASPSPTFLSAGYGGLVDEVRVRTIGPLMTPGGSAWIMDDVAFDVPEPAGVPEPGSLALLGLGLAASLGITRRRVRGKSAQ
jgi:hypothetical protein